MFLIGPLKRTLGLVQNVDPPQSGTQLEPHLEPIWTSSGSPSGLPSILNPFLDPLPDPLLGPLLDFHLDSPLTFLRANFFLARFRLFLAPTNCPWVSEDGRCPTQHPDGHTFLSDVVIFARTTVTKYKILLL